MTLPLLPAPWPYVAYGALVAAFAGAVRGFAGFGLSAFIVAGMSSGCRRSASCPRP